LHDYQPRSKNFYTPIVKKELNFTDEERILQRTLLGNDKARYSSIVESGKATWDRDGFYNRTVNFSK